MKQITTSDFSFESLREGNALYVDKTQFVWNLVSSETKIYLLSRPRRFGKSLLLSTLESFFLNRRDLSVVFRNTDHQLIAWREA